MLVELFSNLHANLDKAIAAEPGTLTHFEVSPGDWSCVCFSVFALRNSWWPCNSTPHAMFLFHRVKMLARGLSCDKVFVHGGVNAGSHSTGLFPLCKREGGLGSGWGTVSFEEPCFPLSKHVHFFGLFVPQKIVLFKTSLYCFSRFLHPFLVYVSLFSLFVSLFVFLFLLGFFNLSFSLRFLLG